MYKRQRELRPIADGMPGLMGLDDWIYTTAWRAGQGLDLIERELSQDPDSDTRYALLLLAGEQLEAQGKARAATERYQQALELRPGHPVAKAKLVHALSLIHISRTDGSARRGGDTDRQ